MPDEMSPTDVVTDAEEGFPDQEVGPVVKCEPGGDKGGKKKPTPPPCTAAKMKANLEKCDGGIGVWDAAKKAWGKEPDVTVSGVAGGFGGEADMSTGKIKISPNPDCCGATQTLIHELTNLKNKATFAQLDGDGAKGTISREDYTKGTEKAEYEGVSNALKGFDACKEKWGCPPGAKARHEWIRAAKDFEDYYDNLLAEDHKNFYRNFWDTNYKAVWDKKHPPPKKGP